MGDFYFLRWNPIFWKNTKVIVHGFSGFYAWNGIGTVSCQDVHVRLYNYVLNLHAKNNTWLATHLYMTCMYIVYSPIYRAQLILCESTKEHTRPTTGASYRSGPLLSNASMPIEMESDQVLKIARKNIDRLHSSQKVNQKLLVLFVHVLSVIVY